MFSRRTIRSISKKQISISTVSQILWALQGITSIRGDATDSEKTHRTAPSAGKTYPLVTYLISQKGLWMYQPTEHALAMKKTGDLREKIAGAAFTRLNQKTIKDAPVTVLVALDNKQVLEITPILDDALRFAYLEVGHATQNLILQVSVLGLGTCTITSYKTGIVYESLALPRHHRPIYLMPVGIPEEQIIGGNES